MSNVDINFKTTADTSGADKVVEAIDEIGDKAESAGEAAKGSGFDKLFDQQRAIAIGGLLKGLAVTVGEVGSRLAQTGQAKEVFAGMSEEVKVFGSTALTVGASVAEGFATGGPIGAGIAGLTALVKVLGDSFVEANERIAAAEAEVEAAVIAHNKAMRERRREATDRGIEETLNRETVALRAQNAELDRARELRRALSQLADARADLAAKQGLNGGADPAMARQEEIQRNLSGNLEALSEDLGEQIERVDSLRERLKSDIRASVATAAEHGTKSDEAKAAAEKVTESQTAVREALEGLIDFKALIATKREILITRAEAEFADVTSELETSMAAKGKEWIAAIESGGGTLAQSNKEGIAKMQAIVADGKVSADEREALGNALAQALAGLRGDLASLTQASRDHSDAQAGLRRQIADATRAAAEARQLALAPRRNN